MTDNDKNTKTDLLRKKAEALISTGTNSNADISAIEVKRIFHELQVYQLELEMQNDELQKTTTELEQQRIKFSNLFELAPIGYFVINKSAVIHDVNFAGLHLLGFDKAILLQKPFLLYVHKEDTDLFYKYFRQLFLINHAQSCQIRILNAAKQVLNVQIDGIALQKTFHGTMCYLTVTDYTGKQQAELKLKEAKKRLEVALDASLTGIWEIDIITGKVYLDEFCCKLYKCETETFDGKYETLLLRIHPNDRNDFDFNIRKALVENTAFNIRFRLLLPTQQITYLEARAQITIYENNKKCFVGTFTDISEKTILEMEAVRIKEEQQQMILSAGIQAEEKEKKRISEALHNGIAQMLYAIKLNMDQVKEVNSPLVFDQVKTLLNQSIKDIRNISFELAPSILTDFGLAATLEDMAARISNEQLQVISRVSKISKNLDLQLQLNIFRIVQELVSNAIKHAYASKIFIEVTQKSQLVTVIVADDGIGFKNYDDTATPKGIGLSSIRNRLQIYNGTMIIEPRLKTGSVIRITLKN